MLFVLQSMGLQRVRHNWATELNWTECYSQLLLWNLAAFPKSFCGSHMSHFLFFFESLCGIYRSKCQAHILSWSFFLFLFWHVSLREIICLVVSSCEHTFKVSWENTVNQRGYSDYLKQGDFQYLECTLGPWTQDTNQSKSNVKDLFEGITFLSQVSCLVMLYSLLWTFPEVQSQV